jgi:colicin import membrane protein
MKPGMTISCAGHAAALLFGLIAISAQPMEAPPVQALPVSFVSEKDFTQLTQGVKNAPQLKVPDIKPLADKVDETKSVDQLAPKVSTKPEITTPTAKPVSEAKPEVKPAPKPEQKIEPKPEQKAESKPESKPEPKPEQKVESKPEPKAEVKTELKPAQKLADKPDKPAPPEYRPDQIANLLKKDAAKDPPKREDAPTPTHDSTPKFDANQVAQLLDKREPQRQVATAQTINDTATLGAAAGAQNAQLSQSEIDALRARISSCWSPPPGIDANSRVYVVLRVLFKPDGSLVQAPVPVEGSASALGPALAESAKRALLLCQPFTMLRPEHYDQWKDLELKFDPHELLGG